MAALIRMSTVVPIHSTYVPVHHTAMQVFQEQVEEQEEVDEEHKQQEEDAVTKAAMPHPKTSDLRQVNSTLIPSELCCNSRMLIPMPKQPIR